MVDWYLVEIYVLPTLHWHVFHICCSYPPKITVLASTFDEVCKFQLFGYLSEIHTTILTLYHKQ